MACSSKSVKFMKIISLILDTGTVALSYRLKQEVKNAGLNFSQFLIANRHRLFHLYERRNCCECRSAQNRSKVFSKYQWETLFKVNHSVKVCNRKNPCVCQYEPQISVVEDELDLSILCAILQNVCSLKSAELQDVKNIREKRNTFLHTKAASIEEDEYLKEFSSIRSTIESIAFYCGQEVFNKVKDEIENISKSELNDNMCRHVFSLLFHIKETTDEKLDSILQEIQDIKQLITKESPDNKTTGQLKSISKDLEKIDKHTSSQRVFRDNVHDYIEKRSSIPTVDVLGCGAIGTSVVSNDECGMAVKRKIAEDNRNDDKKRSKSLGCTQIEISNTLASEQLETKGRENHQSENTAQRVYFSQMPTGSGFHLSCLGGETESEYPDLKFTVTENGWSATNCAASRENAHNLQFMTDKVVPVTETKCENSTILHTACLNAKYEMCQYILLNYPNMLNVVDRNGWNAAHCAARGGDVRILQLLVDRGLPVTETTKEKLTILHIACLFAQFEMFQFILSQSSDMIKFVDAGGRNAAHYAARGGDVRILQMLVDRGLPETETTKDKWTILHIACLYAQFEMCQYILSQYPNMLKLVDTNGWNAAHYAARGGDVRILQMLVDKGLPVTETTKTKWTILHIACLCAQYEMCQYILTQYPNMLKLVDTNGWNAAHYAARGGDVRILQILVDKGLPVTETTKDKWTILHIACLNAQFEKCQYILSQYPDLLTAVDTIGENAAHFAARGGDIRILQLLADKGLPM